MVDYCTVAQIKVALLISDDDDDTEIENILTSQQAIIDNELTAYTTVPLTTVPQIVEDVCIELCRIKYRFIRAPDSESLNVLRGLRKEALNDLARYIAVIYGSSEEAIVIEESRTDYE